MRPVEIFFAFQARPTWAAMFASRDFFLTFGHVECFGYTEDETWFFFDPNRKFADLRITHRHDDVHHQISEIVGKSHLVLKIEPTARLRFPPFHPMTCAGQCGHLAGIRAFTVTGLARKLRAMNADEVTNENPQGRSRREG